MTSTNNVDTVVSGLPISLRTAESPTWIVKWLRFFSSIADYRHRMF
jgi:hypothetical protein